MPRWLVVFLGMTMRVFSEDTDMWVSGRGKEAPPSMWVGTCDQLPAQAETGGRGEMGCVPSPLALFPCQMLASSPPALRHQILGSSALDSGTYTSSLLGVLGPLASDWGLRCWLLWFWGSQTWTESYYCPLSLPSLETAYQETSPCDYISQFSFFYIPIYPVRSVPLENPV